MLPSGVVSLVRSAAFVLDSKRCLIVHDCHDICYKDARKVRTSFHHCCNTHNLSDNLSENNVARMLTILTLRNKIKEYKRVFRVCLVEKKFFYLLKSV